MIGGPNLAAAVPGYLTASECVDRRSIVPLLVRDGIPFEEVANVYIGLEVNLDCSLVDVQDLVNLIIEAGVKHAVLILCI